MSNLSELLPAGAGGKNVEFVASGTLPNGRAVALKSDGTVELVAETTTTVSQNIPLSSELVFESASINFSRQAFVSSDKFIIAYQDQGNSNYGTAVVAIISGSSINFGTPTVFNTGTTGEIGIGVDSTTEKCVIAYQDESQNGYGKCVVGTISGSGLSFGTEVTFLSGYANFCSVGFNPNTSNQCVIAYRYQAGSPHNGRSRLGTVSGTSISFTNETAFSSGSTEATAIAFDPSNTNKFVIAYKSGQGYSVTGTISGTAISYGSPVSISTSLDYPAISFDPTSTFGRFVVAYQDSSGSRYGKARVGLLSGTSHYYGAVSTYNTGNSAYVAVSFDPLTSGSFVIGYRDNDNSYYGTIRVYTISGSNTLVLGSDIVINSGNSQYFGVNFSSSSQGKFLVSYRDAGNSGYGTARTGQISTNVVTTNLTSTNFIGISDEAISSGATGKATIKGGIKTGLSSLTPNAIYYVQTDGTITTASASPAVRIGKALSSTSINLEYNS